MNVVHPFQKLISRAQVDLTRARKSQNPEKSPLKPDNTIVSRTTITGGSDRKHDGTQLCRTRAVGATLPLPSFKFLRFSHCLLFDHAIQRPSPRGTSVSGTPLRLRAAVLSQSNRWLRPGGATREFSAGAILLPACLPLADRFTDETTVSRRPVRCDGRPFLRNGIRRDRMV